MLYYLYMLKYFDAHCHLENISAPETGVGRIINAARYSDWPFVVAGVSLYTYGAIGIHPWYISELPNDWDARLYDTLVQNPDLMVGEIGLDKHRPDIQGQTSVFIRQLEIAHSLGRGVHVHSTGTLNRITEILDSCRNVLPPFILFHRYSGSASQMVRLSEKYNAYFSFCDASAINRSGSVPTGRILSETDSIPGTVISVVAENLAAALDTDTSTFVRNAARMLGK